jgi:hypothetical protein
MEKLKVQCPSIFAAPTSLPVVGSKFPASRSVNSSSAIVVLRKRFTEQLRSCPRVRFQPFRIRAAPVVRVCFFLHFRVDSER